MPKDFKMIKIPTNYFLRETLSVLQQRILRPMI